jgi:hypothetical protein
VLYEGEGTLEVGGAARVAESQPGRMVLEVDAASGGITLFISATTPGNYLRNIRVIMPGGICRGERFRHAADASACADPADYRSFEAEHERIVFHPRFLERIRAYSVLRFMDWGATNNSALSSWAGRPRRLDARWSVNGVPVGVMVRLANRVGADPWFTLPHQADDEYIRRHARLVKRHLDRGRKVYLEYSNEVWNFAFAQAAYAQSRGLALGLSDDPFEAARRFYSKRAVEVFNLWSAEFGDPSRVVRVMGSQAVNPWLSGELLDYGNAAASTDALAIAPYLGDHLQAAAASMTLEGLFLDLELSMPAVTAAIAAQVAVARAHGLPLIAYEGGQHLAGHGGAENIDALNALFDAANRDPRMGALYWTYLNAWKASGATLFVHYLNCSDYSKWGRWGALEYLEQPRAAAPKFDALQTFIERNPAWW